jgi:hypothetical protein
MAKVWNKPSMRTRSMNRTPTSKSLLFQPWSLKSWSSLSFSAPVMFVRWNLADVAGIRGTELGLVGFHTTVGWSSLVNGPPSFNPRHTRSRLGRLPDTRDDSARVISPSFFHLRRGGWAIWEWSWHQEDDQGGATTLPTSPGGFLPLSCAHC